MQHRLHASAQPRAIRMMALLPVVLAAVLATGCGDKGSSEGKATQAAARVNGSEVTVHQINQILERQQGLRPEQADAASRNILEGLIDQQLAVDKAEEQKLDRDPQVTLLDAHGDNTRLDEPLRERHDALGLVFHRAELLVEHDIAQLRSGLRV